MGTETDFRTLTVEEIAKFLVANVADFGDSQTIETLAAAGTLSFWPSATPSLSCFPKWTTYKNVTLCFGCCTSTQRAADSSWGRLSLRRFDAALKGSCRWP